MVETTITFSKTDVQPPVYVAGGFTDWVPVEMASERVESTGVVENRFSYAADLQPGRYQYKFRLGPGDWWVCDESTPTEDDGSGNINNVLTVESEKSHAQPPRPLQDAPPIPLSTVGEKTGARAEKDGKTEDSVIRTPGTHGEEPIPDVAPPPYSAEESGAVTPGSFPAESAAPFSSAGIDKAPSQAKTNESGRSWLSQNLVLVVAIVVVPLAVSLIFCR